MKGRTGKPVATAQMSNPENQQIFSTLLDNSYTNLLAQSVPKMKVKFQCPREHGYDEGEGTAIFNLLLFQNAF